MSSCRSRCSGPWPARRRPRREKRAKIIHAEGEFNASQQLGTWHGWSTRPSVPTQALVVFTLDTPGGLSDATREITQRILASRVPVVVYVAPDGARAGSAGVSITYAAQLAAMAPTTNIGSATPVAFGEGGEQELSPEMRAKVTNDAAAGGARGRQRRS